MVRDPRERLLAVLVAFRLSFFDPVIPCAMDFDFTYTPSLATHLRDTIKGEGHQLKLPGREISRGLWRRYDKYIMPLF